MKKTWIIPGIDTLDLSMTAYDLIPGKKEDDGTWAHDFPSWECKEECS